MRHHPLYRLPVLFVWPYEPFLKKGLFPSGFKTSNKVQVQGGAKILTAGIY
jgi:hypothetical protein